MTANLDTAWVVIWKGKSKITYCTFTSSLSDFQGSSHYARLDDQACTKAFAARNWRSRNATRTEHRARLFGCILTFLTKHQQMYCSPNRRRPLGRGDATRRTDETLFSDLRIAQSIIIWILFVSSNTNF